MTPHGPLQPPMTGGEEGLQGPRLLPAAGLFPLSKALIKAQRLSSTVTLPLHKLQRLTITS